MLSRMNERIFTEQELQSWATIFFKKRRHIFLLCSSTNLDTLASFYHAAKANRIKMFANHYVVSQLKTFSETAGVEDDFYRFSTVWPIQFGKELNKNGFYVTLLNTMGGFLRKRSVTIMIGLESARLDAALAILKKRAGQRTETVYRSIMPPHISEPSMMPTVPLQVSCGGVTVFVLDVSKMEHF